MTWTETHQCQIIYRDFTYTNKYQNEVNALENEMKDGISYLYSKRRQVMVANNKLIHVYINYISFKTENSCKNNAYIKLII